MKNHSDQNTTTSNRANANQSFLSGENESSNPQVATLQPPALFTANPVVQKQSPEEGGSLSLEEARQKIVDATSGIGTDEEAIYDAIRKCNNHKDLINEPRVRSALRGDMSGHDLWKSYLLIEYGNESNYPSPIQKLWTATKGAGTDEEAVFAALDSMDKRAKTSFGLEDILHSELSGDDLEKALDLVTTTDSISGNLYGSSEEGKEELVIKEDKLRELIDSRFVGASTTGLKNAMEILYGKPGGTVLQEALKSIESIRGLAPGSALGQYNKAMEKRLAGVEYYKKHKEEKGQIYNHQVDNPSPALDTGKHESFTASSAQLRFGKVVGDVFGIDAVFGSLISPTGGMAGPGNERIEVPVIGIGPKDGGAVATHGAVHDAAGYLYNSHGIGPGYDYLKKEAGSDASDPLAGQTNINWWIEEFDQTGNDVQYLERFLNDNAYIGAAFSKNYGELNPSQRKDALRVMSETSSFFLKKGGISEIKRVGKIRKLMGAACDDKERTELSDYFYNNDGFSRSSDVFSIMRPYVSDDAYAQYMQREKAKQEEFDRLIRGPKY